MRRSGHRQLEQDEIVATAVEIAIDLGLPAVTTAAVAGRLGVRERAVTALWPDIDALVATTFSRIVGAELAEAEREVLTHRSPAEQLTVLLEALAEPVPHLDSAWVEAWSLGRRNPALGAAVRSEEAGWHAFVATVVRHGVQSGDFIDVDPDLVATHLLAVINGVNAYSLVGYRSNVDRLRMLHAVARAYLGESAPRPAV